MNKYAVVVNSSDSTANYAKGWNWFFQHNWTKDPDIPVYFLTESQRNYFHNVTNVQLSKRPWKKFLEAAFDCIDCKYVMFSMDDHMFIKPLPAGYLKYLFGYADSLKFDRLGLYRKFHPAQEPTIEDDYLGPYKLRLLMRASGYISCLQPSIWRVEYMLDLIEDGWSPWQVEWEGTIKARKSQFRVGYVEIPGWYAEAYQMGKPRPGDYEKLKAIYDWEEE
jgi:hypothetical protein